MQKMLQEAFLLHLPQQTVIAPFLFQTFEFPDKWTQSVIVPLHKKGSASEFVYRGIALLDTLSKLYISILTKRLTFYVESYYKLSGFRASYCTVDNAFVLYSIANKYLSMKRKPLYVAFLDFKKAFDSVDRQLLYQVLRKNGIKGRLFSAVESVYVTVKSCVRTQCCNTKLFRCPVGLKQGCKLSPILFSLFINELHCFLQEITPAVFNCFQT